MDIKTLILLLIIIVVIVLVLLDIISCSIGAIILVMLSIFARLIS